MSTVRYTTINGEVLAEKRNGVRKEYVPDPLGSTVALLDNTQTQTDTFSYWPYGENNVRTGTTPTPFQFVGLHGYYNDNSSKSYVRARYLDMQKGRWLTADPIGFRGGDWNLYRYVKNYPLVVTDSLGLNGNASQLPLRPPRKKFVPPPQPLPPPRLPGGGSVNCDNPRDWFAQCMCNCDEDYIITIHQLDFEWASCYQCETGDDLQICILEVRNKIEIAGGMRTICFGNCQNKTGQPIPPSERPLPFPIGPWKPKLPPPLSPLPMHPNYPKLLPRSRLF